MLKVIKEVSEVSNTQPVTWQIYGHDHFSECPYASFALLGTAALPVLIDLPQTSLGSGCILALCLRICVRTSLLALSFLLLSLFSVIDVTTMHTATALGKIYKLYTTFCNCITKRDGSWGYTPPTVLAHTSL